MNDPALISAVTTLILAIAGVLKVWTDRKRREVASGYYREQQAQLEASFKELHDKLDTALNPQAAPDSKPIVDPRLPKGEPIPNGAKPPKEGE